MDQISVKHRLVNSNRMIHYLFEFFFFGVKFYKIRNKPDSVFSKWSWKTWDILRQFVSLDMFIFASIFLMSLTKDTSLSIKQSKDKFLSQDISCYVIEQNEYWTLISVLFTHKKSHKLHERESLLHQLFTTILTNSAKI